MAAKPSASCGGWTRDDSTKLYLVDRWGQGFFAINDAGHLTVVAPGESGAVDLKRLVDDLRRRDIGLPVLVRFSELIRARVEALVGAFSQASQSCGFRGAYRGVFPIKANQDANVVADYVRFAEPHHLGLEAGSKPELQIVLAMLDDPDALVVCNGYKDRSYIELALLAQRMGHRSIVVVEQPRDLRLLLDVAAQLEIEPIIGLRAKLASHGTGRWATSAGDRAKFGLTPAEIVESVQLLAERDALGWLKMLHFHVGSQVSHVRAFNAVMREAMQMYVELVRMGAGLTYVDVGGGLGVDYDGSQTDFESSINYTLEEYAQAIVTSVVEACDRADIPHPDIVTEAGRATVAYHATLIVDVRTVTRSVPGKEPEPPEPGDADEVHALWSAYNSVTEDNLLEPLHDAGDARDQALAKFNLGLLGLRDRARVDALYFATCDRLCRFAEKEEPPIPELEAMRQTLADIYYCNFSLFQSAPDSWAIDQLFPILPIHRLDQEPDRTAILADLTCDSDGKVERFIGASGTQPVLRLHDPGDDPYYLAFCLVGAYQEILGDLHNLFGDTNEVYVRPGTGTVPYRIENVFEGDTIRDVLGQVGYDHKTLLAQLRRRVEVAVNAGALSPEEAGRLVKNYSQSLERSMYLE